MTMPPTDPADVLEGVYVANVTPFRDDERFSIDVDSYLGHVRWLA
jgi:dihydrodipicolinate synthase/N-acetylneuraminate lyase